MHERKSTYHPHIPTAATDFCRVHSLLPGNGGGGYVAEHLTDDPFSQSFPTADCEAAPTIGYSWVFEGQLLCPRFRLLHPGGCFCIGWVGTVRILFTGLLWKRGFVIPGPSRFV